MKYAGVVSGVDPINMMARITGGHNTTIQPPTLILKNLNRSYPIRVQDQIPGVSYRASPKGWMDSITFKKLLGEPRPINKLPQGQRILLYVDNCSGNRLDDDTVTEILSIGTTLQKFPPNGPHMLQPADSFIIRKVRDG